MSSCQHEIWSYDDRGNHWCQECNLTHDFPHKATDDPSDCDEDRDIVGVATEHSIEDPFTGDITVEVKL